MVLESGWSHSHQWSFKNAYKPEPHPKVLIHWSECVLKNKKSSLVNSDIYQGENLRRGLRREKPAAMVNGIL